MSNKNVQRASRNPEILRSSFEVEKAKQKHEGCDGQMGKFGRLTAKKGRTIREITQNPLLWNKTKEKEEKKQGWFHLDSGQAEADEGSVQRVELPHPGRVVAGSGRRPGPANFPGSLLWLKCVGSMASLAVHSSA